jgi:hypothetical protein
MSKKHDDIIGENFHLSSFKLPINKRTELDGKIFFLASHFTDMAVATIAPRSVILGIYER